MYLIKFRFDFMGIGFGTFNQELQYFLQVEN